MALGLRKKAIDNEVKVIVGGTLDDDLAAFHSAWERTEAGAAVEPERVLAFQSWEGLASVLTGERYRLLRHMHAHREPSVSALARHLGRPLRRVQADIRALETAGLVGRSRGDVRATADRLRVTVELA